MDVFSSVDVELDIAQGKLNLFSQDQRSRYCMAEHPLQLGSCVLSRLRIHFASKEQMLYLSPADTAAADSSPKH